MKQLFFSFFLLVGYYSSGQLVISISSSGTTPKICYGSSMTLNVVIVTPPDSGTLSFQWRKEGAVLTDSTRTFLVFKNVTYADTGFYSCIGKVDSIASDTSNRFHLQVYPKLTIDTLYRYNELGCPGICKGQFLTLISGCVPPYNYDWGGGHAQDTLVFGLCPGT